MLEKNINPAKKILKNGGRVSAGWLQAGSSITAEIFAEAGFDVLFIDLEHGPGDIMTTISQIQAMKGEIATPFTRAPWNDFVQIKKILDAGIMGVLVPYINSKEDAINAVKAVKYPKEGIRGVAGSPRAPHYGNKANDYLLNANNEIFLMAAIETQEAFDNIDEICSVEGVDAIFIGPMDLAAGLGYFGDWNNQKVLDAITIIEEKALKNNKVLASVAPNFASAKIKYDKGYRLVIFSSDTSSLSAYANKEVQAYKDYLSTK